MMAKILKLNVCVLHISTYRQLIPDEISDQEGSDVHDQFVVKVCERLGSQVLPTDLVNRGLEDTPQYDPSEDETQSIQTIPSIQEELEPTSEVADYYLGAEILLPRMYQMARCFVVAHKKDANSKWGESMTALY